MESNAICRVLNTYRNNPENVPQFSNDPVRMEIIRNLPTIDWFESAKEKKVIDMLT